MPDSSIDIILLYYVLHDFHNPYGIIRELYRVLKSDGILTVIDHKLRNKINGKILVFVKTTANQG